jgi:hypothetical protein
MEATSTCSDDLERVRELAQAVDCFVEEDARILANVAPGTTEAWRKRGKGPPYVLFGNRFLYPRPEFPEFLRSRVRERRAIPGKVLL